MVRLINKQYHKMISITALERSAKVLVKELNQKEYEVEMDVFKSGACGRYGYTVPSYVELWVRKDGKYQGSYRFAANGYSCVGWIGKWGMKWSEMKKEFYKRLNNE